MKCKNCQNELQANFKFCPACGVEVNRVFACPSCNNEVKSEWVSCPFCGSPLKSSAKQRDVAPPMHQPQPPQQYPKHPPHYEHGYHRGSSSSRRKHKRGFLGRIFS